MTTTLYTLTQGTFVPQLRNLSVLLDKGAAHATAQGSDFAALSGARLAPDMFTLALQIRVACDQAVSAAARLTGRTPPVFEGELETLDAQKARIAEAIAYIEATPESAFAGAESLVITMTLREGMELSLDAPAFLRDWSFPNFYFHVVTAYDILRHKGVELSKRDYLAHIAGAIRTVA